MRAEGVRGIVAVSSSDAALDRHQRRAEQVEVWQGTVPDRKHALRAHPWGGVHPGSL